MDLDGPVRLSLWPNALDTVPESLIKETCSTQGSRCALRHGSDAGYDHAEGIAMVAQVRLDAFALDPRQVGV